MKKIHIVLSSVVVCLTIILSINYSQAVQYPGNWDSDSGITHRDGEFVRKTHITNGFIIECKSNPIDWCWKITNNGTILDINETVVNPGEPTSTDVLTSTPN